MRVGRYSERDNASPEPNTLPVGFKSKVVSRRHCEFWCTNGGQWYIKDVKSSSGTFLNHVRLSPPGQESRPYAVNDGDVVQLGIDFKGGEEVIFRCVKIRIECNRGWQKSLNAYNTTAHKRLLKSALGKKSGGGSGGNNRDSDAASTNTSECSICLNAVAPCQALFVAPCSHVWHYKCVRDLIHGASWPNFLCPNCRFVADLEADVEGPEEMEGGVEGQEEDDELEEGFDTGREGVAGSTGRGGDGERGEDAQQPAHDHGDEEETQSPATARRNANITDEELASFLQQTSLHDAASSRQAPSLNNNNTLSPPHNNNNLSNGRSATAASRPLPITQPRSPSTSADILGARSTTPTSNAQFALAAGIGGMIADGPMTPRNDAGPFVLDGSGGRERERIDGVLGRAVPEEDERSGSGGSSGGR